MGSTSSTDILRSLDALYDHLPAGVVVHAADGRIVFVNRLAQELLGRSEAELIGTDPVVDGWAVLREDGSVRPPEEFPASIVLRTGQKLSGHIAGIVGAGRTRWLLCNAYPERDSSRTKRD
jgi:PAS domain-containing protein